MENVNNAASQSQFEVKHKRGVERRRSCVSKGKIGASFTPDCYSTSKAKLK